MLDIANRDRTLAAAQPAPPAAAEQLEAIATVLGESRFKQAVALGDTACFICLSLLDAGVVERARLYGGDRGALARARARGLGDRIEWHERPANPNNLPAADLFVGLNMPAHAAIESDRGANARDALPDAWLTQLRRECQVAVVGLEFATDKPGDVPPLNPTRFARSAERAGWSLLYHANVLDIGKLGVERANGRSGRDDARSGRAPRKHRFVKNALARIGYAAGDTRSAHHLYILDAEKPTLPHLVMVAGASGSGKSTFVEQLQARKLPEEIYRRLPAGVGDWPVVGSSMRPIFPRCAAGIVLQYDMNGRGLSKGRDFSDDPLLSDIGSAKAVTVINLRPSPALMIAQLVLREGGGRTKEQLLENPGWQLPQGSRAIGRLLRRWKPWVEQNRRLSCSRKIGLYDQDGWLDAFYARWDAYLGSLGTKGPVVEQIFLEPDQDTRMDSMYSWRIASDPRAGKTGSSEDLEGKASGGIERVS